MGARRKLAGPILACVAAFALVGRAEARPTRLGYLFSDGQMPGTVAAYRQLLTEHPELRGEVELRFLTETTFDDEDVERIADVDVLVLDVMNQQMVERFDRVHDTDLLSRVESNGDVLAVGEGLLGKEHYVELGARWDERARRLFASSGPANQLALMKLALDLAGVPGLEVPRPVPALDFGYYATDRRGDAKVFASWDAFDAWRRSAGKTRPGAARVAIGFYAATYYGGDTRVLDAVIAEVERQGAEAIPVFGYPSHVAFERLLLDEGGAPRADVALAFLFRFAQPDSTGALERLGIPILNLTTLYGRSAEQWRRSSTGLSPFEGTFQVAAPELAGLIAPTVVGSRERVTDPATGLAVVVNEPIAERVETAVRRALRYAALRSRPNREKHVALLYYDYPPGKAGVGASYLNVAESISNILGRLGAEGYELGDCDLGVEAVLDSLTRTRNVGGYAPGELEEMLLNADAVRIPSARYRQWLGELTPALRASVLEDWGPVEEARAMTLHPDRGPPEIVVPLVRCGNVVLMPQPARGWGENREALYHAQDLAPPHQYVAAYAWLRHDFAADAVIHVGTHGTLEWLDGKSAGLSADDAPDALLGDLPDLYVYSVDVVGEGLVARRRAAATLIDHMTPPFRKGGLYRELAELSELISDHDVNLGKNPDLARRYAEEIRRRALELGIAKDLGLEIELADEGGLDHDAVHEIQDYLLRLEEENIPYGLHAFGRAPGPSERASTVDAIVSVDRSLLSDQREILADEMERRIVESGPRELDRLVLALDGGYVPGGNGGEPIRNPDVYPTGKNFYGIDPAKIPKRLAWELGVELADEMLAEHLEKHARYPEKVSFVIWGDETMRHEGVLESQIFHLLGTRPVWDERGNVKDVEIVPRSALGRPRIDVVVASAAEGMFYNVTRLIDEAVQRVAVLEEADNLVRRHTLDMRDALVALGYSEGEAKRRAGVRIFDEAPGVFNLNTSRLVEASGTWETDAGIANDYLKKMGHGYGNGFWGEPMENTFRLALSGTDKVVHSSSTTLYGALDNDDFYMYLGGLATAVRSLDGETPEMVVTNTRDPDRPEMTAIDRFLGSELRSRYFNPTWIRGMQKEGYAGAGEMRKLVEHLWGWDVTATETVDDATWQQVFDVYVEDEHQLDMREFFEESSPFAYQDMTARMLETVRKGYWQADESVTRELLEEYLESVDRHGVSCADHTCGNPRFLRWVAERSRNSGVPTPLVEDWQRRVEQMVGGEIAPLAASADAFVGVNEQRIARRLEQARTGRAPAEVRGLRMEPVSSEGEQRRHRGLEPRRGFDAWLLAVAVLAALLVWRRVRGAEG